MPAVCVFVVVYSGCEAFLRDYLACLPDQSKTGFDLLIVSDGFDEGRLKAELGSWVFGDYEIITAGKGSSIAMNRGLGLRRILERGYKKIVLTDIDDTYSQDRIGRLAAALDRHGFVVNDLEVETCHGRHRILQENGVPSKVSADFLLTRNVAGFGNSAMRGDIIRDLLPIPEDIIAVDWWLSTVSSILHGEITFIEEPLTIYRQHPNNLIGMTKGTDTQKIKMGLQVKKRHYKGLSENNRIPALRRDIFHELYHKTVDLEEAFGHNEILEQYVEAVNKRLHGRIPLWWEDIILLEELGV